jgi:pilus assembly protein CpaB
MKLAIPKGAVYIGVALAAGLVATFAVQRYVKVKTYIAPVATNQVAVAVTDITPGTALSAGQIKVSSWPKELVPDQVASSLKQLEGRVAVTQIGKGEPITMNKLAPEGTVAGLGGLLDENKRALTVRVDDVSGVAGFIHPGDRVDVLSDIKIPDSKENFSKIILQNINVLTTGQIWERRGENKPMVVNTVTLELEPEQTEVMNLASNEGKIRLALRSRRNEAIVTTSGVVSSQLISPGAKVGEKAAPQLNVKEERTVEVIKGLERSKVSL